MHTFKNYIKLIYIYLFPHLIVQSRLSSETISESIKGGSLHVEIVSQMNKNYWTMNNSMMDQRYKSKKGDNMCNFKFKA